MEFIGENLLLMEIDIEEAQRLGRISGIYPIY
jgi:hypothetical protein